MRIAILSTEAGSGGAARAMQRLALGLRGRGHTVDPFVSGPVAHPDREVRVRRRELDPAADRFADICSVSLDGAYVAARRTPVSTTSFSTQIAGFDLAALPLMRSYDVVNVHWTGSMMSPPVLGNLIDLGIPTVFTLHDMAHFTGGCHYPAGCRGFEADCEPCHQVSPDELGLIRHSLAQKRSRYRKSHVRAVSPSGWLARQAHASRVFASPAQVIPNGIETAIFRPLDRPAIRRELGLEDDTRAILFGVYDNAERRKGFEALVGVLKRCLAHPAFARRVEAGLLRFITFGKSQQDLGALGVPFLDCGWIGDDERLSRVYNAADLCLLPSSEDNQPNVMVESMACGTPVVAFAVGGIPETIVNGETGRLIEPFDLDAMAAATIDLIEDRDGARRLGEAAAAAMRALTPDRQAQAYESVFEDLVSQSGWRAASAESDVPRHEGMRSVSAPFVLDPVLETKPIAPILAAQVAALTEELAAVKANRDLLHGQLVNVTDELVAVTANRDTLHEQLVAVNEHSAARDAELELLKGKLTNRIILKLRDRWRARSGA